MPYVVEGFTFVVCIPGLAVSVRRLHDISKSGWTLLTPFIQGAIGIGFLIISMKAPGNTQVLLWFGIVFLIASSIMYFFVSLAMMCRDSEKGTNAYGTNPKIVVRAKEDENRAVEETRASAGVSKGKMVGVGLKNRVVHVFVYAILTVVGVALYFVMNLVEKVEKSELLSNNEHLRCCIVRLSSFIEAEDAPPAAGLDAKKDVSAREAREVDDPDTENLLEDYHPEYEKADLKLMKWGDSQAAQLRRLYALDAEGNKQPDVADPGKFITKGAGTAQELVESITGRASKQYEMLGKTRHELASVRAKLQKLVTDYNELPKEIRLLKIEVEKRDKEIENLNAEKAVVDDQLQKSQAEVASAKKDTEVVKEALEKEKKKVEHLTKLLKMRTAAPRDVGSAADGGTS